MTKLKDLLYHKRNLLGLTLDDVAKHIDCTPQFVKNMERGVALIPAKKLTKMAQILKVKEQELEKLVLKEIYLSYIKRVK